MRVRWRLNLLFEVYSLSSLKPTKPGLQVYYLARMYRQPWNTPPPDLSLSSSFGDGLEEHRNADPKVVRTTENNAYQTRIIRFETIETTPESECWMASLS